MQDILIQVTTKLSGIASIEQYGLAACAILFVLAIIKGSMTIVKIVFTIACIGFAVYWLNYFDSFTAFGNTIDTLRGIDLQGLLK